MRWHFQKYQYEVHPKDIKRQCVFTSTSNNMQFLPFERFGNRRFIPVPVDAAKAECHPLADEKAAREFIRMCCAEALVIFKSGNFSFVVPKEIEERLTQMQKDFMPEDNISGLIEAWLEDCPEEYVCSTMIYHKAVAPLSAERPNQFVIKEIAEVMNAMDGWEKVSSHRFPEYGTQRAWKRKSDFIPVGDEKNLPWAE